MISPDLAVTLLTILASLTSLLQSLAPIPVSPLPPVSAPNLSSFLTSPVPSSPIPPPTPTLSPTKLLPIITSITPTSGPPGTRVTIKGSNFAPTGNKVYTGYGPVILPSSNGGTQIIVTISPPGLTSSYLEAMNKFLAQRSGATRPILPVGLYVETKVGRTARPALFEIKL